jgi:hypothetical protein
MDDVKDLSIDITLLYDDINSPLRPSRFDIVTTVTMENGDVKEYFTPFKNLEGQGFAPFDILNGG